MDKADKEVLVEEIMEFNDILESVGLQLDTMMKSFIMVMVVQEVMSEIKNKRREEGLKLIKVGRVFPPHCPYLGEPRREHGLWKATCKIREQEDNCDVTVCLGEFHSCLDYRAQEVQTYMRSKSK